MSTLPVTHQPQNPIGTPGSFPQNPGETPQSRQSNAGPVGQLQSFPGQQPQLPPHVQVQPSGNPLLAFGIMDPANTSSLPCCGFPDIRIVIILLGIIHLLFQLAVLYKFGERFGSLQGRLDKYRYREDVRLKELEELARNVRQVYEQYGDSRKDEIGRTVQKANEIEFETELDSREIYLAIAVFSTFNALAALAFLFVTSTKGGKATFLVCYIVGPILNFIIIGLHWRIVPGRADGGLTIRSIIFNSSVVIAVIYHACGFVLMCSILHAETRSTGLNTIPLPEIYPTGNPSRVTQQQYRSAPASPSMRQSQ